MNRHPTAASPLGTGLCNASILLYSFWLLLPAVQTTGRALAGCGAVGLFALGALLDLEDFSKHWGQLILQALCAMALPLLLWAFVGRGASFWGFYVQNLMLWYPLIFCSYARRRGDPRLWRWLRPALLTVMAVTTLTTIGWLIEGFLRGGRVYAYSRSLGNGEPGREAYLKELMLRNIGGYDFIYATVISLPLTVIGVQSAKGWRRAAFVAFLCAQTIMIALSQYTYAMVFAAALLATQALAALLRKGTKISLGPSLLWGAAPLALAWLLRVPLVAWAAALCDQLGLSNFSFSLHQLLTVLSGDATESASRLTYYQIALKGFFQSPLTGSLFGGEKLLSGHSDLLDLLSGMGVLGAALVGGMIWVMARGSLRGLSRSPYRAQWAAMATLLTLTGLLGTVVYSREITLAVAMGTLLMLEGEKAA